MEQRALRSRVFLLLILAQAAHSVEECVARLYAVFTPARTVGTLVGDNPALGFAVANGAIVGAGLLCWAVPVRAGRRNSGLIVWTWTIVELVNRTVHCTMAIARGGYFPGLATAPLLLLFAGWLGAIQLRGAGERQHDAG